MSDLTKCSDAKCPSRAQCRRYTDKASPLQSYADFNRAKDDDKCAGGFEDNGTNHKPATP